MRKFYNLTITTCLIIVGFIVFSKLFFRSTEERLVDEIMKIGIEKFNHQDTILNLGYSDTLVFIKFQKNIYANAIVKSTCLFHDGVKEVSYSKYSNDCIIGYDSINSLYNIRSQFPVKDSLDKIWVDLLFENQIFLQKTQKGFKVYYPELNYVSYDFKTLYQRPKLPVLFAFDKNRFDQFLKRNPDCEEVYKNKLKENESWLTGKLRELIAQNPSN